MLGHQISKGLAYPRVLVLAEGGGTGLRATDAEKELHWAMATMVEYPMSSGSHNQTLASLHPSGFLLQQKLC